MQRIHITLGSIAILMVSACIPTTTGTTPPPTGTTTSTTSTTTSTTTTTTLPPEIAITATAPSSPAESISPSVIGFAPSATTTVRVFASTDCSGPALGAGSLATFSTTGITVSVGLGTTTELTALASGPGITLCSAPFSYVNSLTAPTATEHEPNNGVSQANAIAVAVGAPADILGVLDGTGPGAGDLFTFTAAPGQSIRIETFDWTGAHCAATDTIILVAPLPSGLGGNDDDGGIDLCSLLAPNVGTYGANFVDVPGGDYLLNVRGTPLGGQYRVRVELFD